MLRPPFHGNGAVHFVCMDWRHIGELLAAADPIYGATLSHGGGTAGARLAWSRPVVIFDSAADKCPLSGATRTTFARLADEQAQPLVTCGRGRQLGQHENQ
jgi:hypothetical protein